MKKILILLITFFFAQNYYSQEITVSYPAKIGLGQAFTLQFSVNKQGSNPQIRNNNKVVDPHNELLLHNPHNFLRYM